MTNIIDILRQTLVGKKLKHRNQHSREVILEVEDVQLKHHSIQITPDTPENDWWGQTQDWQTINVCFVDGSSKEFDIHSKFEII